MPVEKRVQATSSKEAVREKRIARILLILAIVTTVLAVAVAAFEVSAFPKPEPKKKVSGSHILPIMLKPPVPPLAFLPDFITQYATKGRQALIGTKYPAAEAVYEKLDANVMLASPINIYAKVTFFPSQEEAGRDIKDALARRYPNEHSDLLLGSQVAKTGYDLRGASYFIGWTVQNYSIKIYSSYAGAAPAGETDLLREHVLPIAKAIQSSAKINK
ncbi:MAG: hypothetical protein IBX64_07985 [Actinobacteria bacterium]|nr:hypothetical protein [Actinomycetota bacterium]